MKLTLKNIQVHGINLNLGHPKSGYMELATPNTLASNLDSILYNLLFFINIFAN